MTLSKTLLIASSAVLFLLLSLGVTLPYWLPAIINITPFASSVQVSKAGWEKPTQLRVEQLVYHQENIIIKADDITLSWTELLDFSLSAMAVDIGNLQVTYQQATSEKSKSEKPSLRLPLSEQLPLLTIANAEVIYDQVKMPVRAKLVHKSDRAYPLHVIAEYQNETLSTVNVRWEEEKLYGSLALQGLVLNQLLKDPLVAVTQTLDLEGIKLSGELGSDFDVDLASPDLKARVVVPAGEIEHKQFNLTWTTPLKVDLNATHNQWQAKLIESTDGSFHMHSDVYEQTEWPAFIKHEQLPQTFSYVLKKGVQLNSQQEFSGDAELKAVSLLLSLEQLRISEERQQGQWSLQLNSPSWLDLEAGIELTGEGDFLHHDDWVVNLTPNVVVRDWQYADLQCQLITSETDKAIQLTLKNDELNTLQGVLSTTFNQCRQGDLQLNEGLTQLNIVSPEQANLTFEWPNYLTGELKLNWEESLLRMQMDVHSEETNALLHRLSPDFSSLAVHGTAKVEGQAFVDMQQTSDISGQWKASFAGYGQYDDIQVSGVDVQVLGELNQQMIAVQPSSYIQFDDLDPGVPIRNLKGWVSGQVSTEQVDLLLTNISGQLLEGSLALDSIALKPEPTGTALLKLDNVTLNALAQLQSQPGIELQGQVSGRFPVEFDSSGVHVKEGQFYNITPGFIRVKDNPEVQNLKQSSEQAAQALNLLENLDFEVLNSTVNFTPEGDLTLAVSIEGRNPDIDQAINFNYTHEENLYQLLQSLRLGDKLTEKVQQQYQERTQ